MSNDNPSFVLQKANHVSYEDRPVPKISSPDDVIVAVKFTGICGSDVHYWQHGAIGDYVVKSPMVLGHESSGIVHEIGSGVKTLQVGDRVALEPGVGCRKCVRCREGRYNLCADMRFAATPPYDGTLARYYKLPEDLCYRLPDNVSLEQGALVEPLSVACHLVNTQAQLRPGQSVVIFGAGPIGLVCCAVARALGASKIVVIDINEERLAFAKTYAATHTFQSRKESPQDSAARIKSECQLGEGADVVIEASGAAVCTITGLYVLHMGGVFVQGGMGTDKLEFPIMHVAANELTVKGSFRYGVGDYALAVQLLGQGMVKVDELITSQVEFDNAEEAYRQAKAAKGIKILIKGPK